MTHQVKHLGEENRFVVYEDGETAEVVYQIIGNEMAILHTLVPVALQNRGIGSAMTKAALEFCEKHGLRVNPVCPFAQAYIMRHPEYRKLVN